MARVIEFHFPNDGKTQTCWTCPAEGKLLQFRPPSARKPVSSGDGAGKIPVLMADVPLLRKMPIL
jgi:hypothetical protein